MTDAHDAIVETTNRMFRDLGEPQALVTAGDERWKAPLWRALEDAGLTRAWVPEGLNGAGAEISDGFGILVVAGAYAVAIPLAETLLAGWLLAQAGLAVPAGTMTLAPVRDGDHLRMNQDGTLSGRAAAVPFAREAEHLAVVAERGGRAMVALVARAQCALENGYSIAGEPSDTVVFDGVRPVALAEARREFTADNLLLMGAAVRAAQMSGALQGILERSVAYANERIAFERPIGKFQAIQHGLARLAGEAAAATAAAGSAADAIENAGKFDDEVVLEIASAKIRVGEAAGAGAAIAHQVHGAIGFSTEHVLHRYTQRLWAWRDEFGGEAAWALRLGAQVAARGADALWPLLAAR